MIDGPFYTHRRIHFFGGNMLRFMVALMLLWCVRRLSVVCDVMCCG